MSWLKDDSGKNVIRNPILMKTFFRGECSIDENIEFFKKLPEKESVFPSGYENVDSVSRQYEKGMKDRLRALYWKFTIDFGVMYEKMLREWSKNCIKELETLKK